jgi:hypothetical protein
MGASRTVFSSERRQLVFQGEGGAKTHDSKFIFELFKIFFSDPFYNIQGRKKFKCFIINICVFPSLTEFKI